MENRNALPVPALSSEGLARWALLAVGIAVGGLIFAVNAADDYMYVCGWLFVGFGVLLGIRLLGRWTP